MKEFYFNIQQTNYPLYPFHPNKQYLENDGYFKNFDRENTVYGMVRDLLIAAKLDNENIGTKKWNPFRSLIDNNQIAVLKPNLVMEEKRNLIGSSCITTHTSILRPILDYLYLLMKQDNIEFKIIIADVPIQSANFELLIKQNGLLDLVEYYDKEFGLQIDLLDLRKEIASISENGFIIGKKKVDNDPLGYTNVHMDKSFLDDIIDDQRKFSISGYNDQQTSETHNKGNHYYQIPNTVISSDLFINVPKIKTHQKAGITIALKNLIGINGDKSWIPHYRKGIPLFGGDEFSSNNPLMLLNRIINSKIKNEILWNIKKRIINLLKGKQQKAQKKSSSVCDKYSDIGSGSWYGNDTLWRPILDLNKLIMYINKEGKMTDEVQRKYLCFSDGIIAGMGNGPIEPLVKKAGLISFSFDPVVNDICCSRIMGFSWRKIAQLRNAKNLYNFDTFNGNTDDLLITGKINQSCFKNLKYIDLPNLKFTPSPGWINHIEIEES